MDNWTRPPGTLDLQRGQVDIWRVSLDASTRLSTGLQTDSVKQITSTLSADEIARAARFHFPADRDHFIVAHASLRDILSRYLHCQPGELTFSVNQFGKPRVDNFTLEFNLSHSNDFALIAVAQQRKVGVDIERIRSDLELENITTRNFSKSEISELMGLSVEQRVTGFFNCWTRKEAYIKAHGLGLSFPLESFDVSLRPNEPAIIRATRPDQQEVARWTLFSLHVDSEYASAVAVEDENPQLRLWDWNK